MASVTVSDHSLGKAESLSVVDVKAAVSFYRKHHGHGAVLFLVEWINLVRQG